MPSIDMLKRGLQPVFDIITEMAEDNSPFTFLQAVTAKYPLWLSEEPDSIIPDPLPDTPQGLRKLYLRVIFKYHPDKHPNPEPSTPRDEAIKMIVWKLIGTEITKHLSVKMNML
jgi:hypothetical protein